MKRFLLAMGAAALAFALTACENSASNASADSNQQASERSGSFPKNGDPNFYCEVTSGEGWAQIKVNIPNYMGHVEKRSYDATTDVGTQYYEESYYNLNPFQKSEMCLEYERDVKNDKKRNITDFYCGHGVFFMVVTAENASRYIDEFTTMEDHFIERCREYREDWDNGVYDHRDEED